MKPPISFHACLALALVTASGLRAEESSPEIAGLAKAASDFVAAFNKKDAAAVAALFTENGEFTDLHAGDITSGRAAIQAHYEGILAAPGAPQIAIEVDSVRLVGTNNPLFPALRSGPTAVSGACRQKQIPSSSKSGWAPSSWTR